MIEWKKYLCTIGQAFIMICCLISYAHAQENINVQVKVYDKELKPFAGIEVIIEDTIHFTTNSQGLAFVNIPRTSLPPKHIKLTEDNLEAESWNYSKGILEILIRKLKYKEFTFRLINEKDKTPLADIKVKVKGRPEIMKANQRGEISVVLPGNTDLTDRELIQVDGYNIVTQEIDESGGIIFLDKIGSLKVESHEDYDSGISSPDSNEFQIRAMKKVDSIVKEDIDSISSLTSFYSLLKDIDYRMLDESSRKIIDEKYNLLIQENTSFIPENSLELITDSSLIDEDIQLMLEKIYYERDMLNQSIAEFEKATNHISDKLKNGGTNLSIDERRELIELVLSIKEMLQRNEEIFNRNNDYYLGEIDGLLGQLANIHELEDMLKESEAMSEELRNQLIYATATLLAVLTITMLLIYLVRLFQKQKQKLFRANQEIQRMNKNLEGIVAEKTKSLKLINNELDTFMYRSSHNLRRPITSIRGLANIAQITLGNEALSLFDKVVFTANEMEKMLNKLAMMSYINQPTDFGEVDLPQMIHDIRSRFELIIKEENIQLEVSITSGACFKTYPFVLESILINLFENALFYSHYNSKPRVDLKIDINNEGILNVSVRDNGCGINPEIEDKIWNMFFVGNVASKGNGLGLFIAKKAIESLHGSIEVNTEVGKFTEFVVELPELHPHTKLTLADQKL